MSTHFKVLQALDRGNLLAEKYYILKNSVVALRGYCPTNEGRCPVRVIGLRGSCPEEVIGIELVVLGCDCPTGYHERKKARILGTFGQIVLSCDP